MSDPRCSLVSRTKGKGTTRHATQKIEACHPKNLREKDVKIYYVDDDLKDLIHSHKKLQKQYGNSVAKKVEQRIHDIGRAQSVWDLKNFPGDFKPLTGKRQGQFSMRLNKKLRLIFVKAVEHPSAVCIIEITNPHKG